MEGQHHNTVPPMVDIIPGLILVMVKQTPNQPQSPALDIVVTPLDLIDNEQIQSHQPNLTQDMAALDMVIKDQNLLFNQNMLVVTHPTRAPGTAALMVAINRQTTQKTILW